MNQNKNYAVALNSQFFFKLVQTILQNPTGFVYIFRLVPNNHSLAGFAIGALRLEPMTKAK